MTDPFAIPAAHYDGLLHSVPFETGGDFIAKLDAYRADGFTYSIATGELLVCKIMPGDPIPARAA